MASVAESARIRRPLRSTADGGWWWSDQAVMPELAYDLLSKPDINFPPRPHNLVATDCPLDKSAQQPFLVFRFLCFWFLVYLVCVCLSVEINPFTP